MKRYSIFPLLTICVFLISGCKLFVNQPNVIVIVCDQLNPRTIGWTGETEVGTPNLDRFSESAYCFSNAYCTSPVGGPALHSLYTGVYPSQHWVLKNDMTMKDSLQTIIAMFNGHNYTTANIGDLCSNPLPRCDDSRSLLSNDFAINSGGFSAYTSYLKSELGKRNMGYNAYKKRFDGINLLKNRNRMAIKNPLPEELTLEHWITNKALEFIDNRAESLSAKPFFLNISYRSLQQFYSPIEKYANMYLDKMEELKLPPNFSEDGLQKWYNSNSDGSDSLSIEDVKYLRAMYLGIVSQLDAALGELFQGIKDRGLMENTIIVFTSQYGDSRGELEHFYARNMGEASVGVPLIMHLPGTELKKRKVIDANVSHVDLVSTLLKLSGISPAENSVGKDLIHAIKGEMDWSEHSVYAECYKYGVNPSQLMLRKGDYKLTYNIENEEGMFEIKLYNIIDDPWEQKDLAESSEHGVILMEMSDELMNDYWKKIFDSVPRDLF